ncbi:MAG: FecR family protein, partial [Flavobacteriaceae bacterium]|nr:FecR family protein [Flavobacteriaceae bacterium]
MDEKNLLEKWLNNSLSDAEKEAFEKTEAFPFYKKLVTDASHFKASHFADIGDYESLRQRLFEKEVPVRKLNPTPWLLRIASVFVVGIALYYFLFFNPEVRVETLARQQTNVELPDNSLVVLNTMSEMAYTPDSWEKERSLKLKGEAFFDVAKGSRFDVITELGTVSVLGTEFNVKQRDSIFEVICYEGKVKVVSGLIAEEIRPGDRLQFTNGKFLLSKTFTSGPQWTDNISDFQEAPLIEVIKELQRQYGVKVELIDIEGDRTFTGGFVHGDLQNALRSIAEPLGLDFQINDNKVVTLK